MEAGANVLLCSDLWLESQAENEAVSDFAQLLMIGMFVIVGVFAVMIVVGEGE